MTKLLRTLSCGFDRGLPTEERRLPSRTKRNTIPKPPRVGGRGSRAVQRSRLQVRIKIGFGIQIDQFIYSTLERDGLKPNADADRVTLVRRLAFDLTGLPPTVPELYDFALSANPRPLSEMVDRYLDSAAYAERFARRWLDVARYAESAGKDLNGVYPHAWRYRDYCHRCF